MIGSFMRTFFPPALTGRLIIIVIFLFITAIGNAFGVYDALVNNNLNAAFNSLVAVLLYLIPAIGLLKLKRWARMFELGLSILLVILGIILMATFNMTFGVITIVPHGLIAIYLLSKDCRQAFGLITD